MLQTYRSQHRSTKLPWRYVGLSPVIHGHGSLQIVFLQQTSLLENRASHDQAEMEGHRKHTLQYVLGNVLGRGYNNPCGY